MVHFRGACLATYCDCSHGKLNEQLVRQFIRRTAKRPRSTDSPTQGRRKGVVGGAVLFLSIGAARSPETLCEILSGACLSGGRLR